MRTRYWDWTQRALDGPHYLRFCGTPPVPHVFAMVEALRMIAEEGLERGGRGTARSRAPCAPPSAPGRICREHMGVTLGLGIGGVQGTSFRIGHMGHVNAPMILGVIGTIETALHRMGVPIAGSGVAAAAAALGPFTV
jgi:alanine-glyoxylate transaminase / serine-glyoxylate transaminase / serine-pyruvate transaminase